MTVVRNNVNIIVAQMGPAGTMLIGFPACLEYINTLGISERVPLFLYNLAKTLLIQRVLDEFPRRPQK